MDFLEAIRTRRSIRSYDSKPVEKEKLSNILEAARLSPSATDAQPWSFIVITDTKVKQALRQAYDRERLVSAPAVIVAWAFPEKAWVRHDGDQFRKADVLGTLALR